MKAVRQWIPRRWRQRVVRTLVLGQLTPRVMSGPFRGMRYIGGSAGSSYYPKLLGCYEKELHEVVEMVCRQKPDVVVDVGAAEGYYAVGLSVRLPSTSVVAFEMNSGAQAMLRELATRNGTGDRVAIKGQCEPLGLERALANYVRPWVICDVEGYEAKLLDPVGTPSLRRASILVELHPHLSAEVDRLLNDRFIETHQICRIACRSRTENDYAGRLPLPRSYRRSLVIERGPLTPWLVMTPSQTDLPLSRTK